MIQIFILQLIVATGYCASYQRYDDSSQYSSYTTTNYNQNQFPYKANYGNGAADFPDSNRFSNYKSAYTTGSPNIYGNNVNYQPGYSTPSYGRGYGYSGQTYGQGVSPYEMPFMGYNADYCVNRSPQHGIFVNDLGGIWQGVEIIQHLSGDSGVEYMKRCIVVHISEPQDKVCLYVPSFKHKMMKKQNDGINSCSYWNIQYDQ